MRAPVGALLALALAATPGCRRAAVDGGGAIELKFGHVGAPGSLFALSAEEFARRVDQQLDGRVKVLVFGSSQLGGDETLLQKLKLGTVDFALPSTIMSSTIDEFGLFEMPYLVESREHMKRIEREIVWPTLEPVVERRGYKMIAVWENGFRHVTNNLRPIVRPDDLRGIKLRTPRGKWRVRMFQAFGANPTPMPLSEVFVALQTGVMDGQENPLTQIYSSKFQEVQRFLSLTGHVYTPAFVMVSRKSWAKLPEDVRAALEEIARATQSFVYETAARLDVELRAELEAAGVEVNEIDRESFAVASKPIYEEFATLVQDGGTLIEHALRLGTDAH
ncbi:MAG: TRAP transporter substrate-binding protein [Gemmatimonadales bacterium]